MSFTLAGDTLNIFWVNTYSFEYFILYLCFIYPSKIQHRRGLINVLRGCGGVFVGWTMVSSVLV